MSAMIRSGLLFSNWDLRQVPSCIDAQQDTPKKPIPANGDTVTKQRRSHAIAPKDQEMTPWTAMAWPTHIQSRTPDGRFGPADQMNDWSDCWFLAALAAVANDQTGRKILAESIETVRGGYEITFKGWPYVHIFISNTELQATLSTCGGDADTRLMELAADKLFRLRRGEFESLYLATLRRGGISRQQAIRCFQFFCQRNGVNDPMTHNPMRGGALALVAFFMFTGRFADRLFVGRTPISRDDVMRFLNRYVIHDSNGASVTISGIEDPLGRRSISNSLVVLWDAIRTEIASNGPLNEPERAFLNALDRWLTTSDSPALRDLRSAAGYLDFAHSDPVEFVNLLADNVSHMEQAHLSLLRSGVQAVLFGRSGYIGFPGGHGGILEGINTAANTFTYSEPNYSTLVHTGELSRLVAAIQSRQMGLWALDLTTGPDEAESSHAGEKRGRHLRQIYHQAAGDGTIDHAESGPLANLMAMDDGAFWHVYDRDKNGMIEGGEVKAVQLRVERWVDAFALTPIW